MPSKPSPFSPATLIQYLVQAYRPVCARGVLLDGPAHLMALRSSGIAIPPQTISAKIPTEGLANFIIHVQELLGETDEAKRQQLEDEVLVLAGPLHAAGMFEVLNIAHPALATMVNEHLTSTMLQDSCSMQS